MPEVPPGPVRRDPDVEAALRAAVVADVAWTVEGRPRVHGVLPLVGPDGPVLALPWSELETARSLAAAGRVLLCLSEPQGAGRAWRPLGVRARTRLEEDPEGDVFTATLLEQELLRWPPSRLLADSVLLRREHWWWLPRLLVHLEVLDDSPLGARESREDQLLVVAGDGAGGWPEATVTGPAGALRGPAPAPGPALLLGQELSWPDLERWGRWSWQGRWDGAQLQVEQAPGSTGLPPVPGLLRRWRRHRALERACRAGLAAAPPATPRVTGP
ncbi:hypothetical protein JOE61_002127 [Nocardioides salarius]|uniref:Pyridoxamine 5'-phosphate oxidase family protein n=1 Tax=Nocardioides salarius TaxID=374513 RepID=A0ABS2MAU5_9ACTN|nr:pyridoxamine 5'-phosphate oxidase family protein [Nocardioides salarius]MBM7508313.1 hypothetical protein [Nocardioides salarius]